MSVKTHKIKTKSSATIVKKKKKAFTSWLTFEELNI